MVYGSPPWDEPVIGWQRAFHSKGAFNLLLDGAYDEEIDATAREFDPDKRAKLTHDLGQKLYDGYHGVMLGMKSTTWAVIEEGRRLANAGLYADGDQLRVREPRAMIRAHLLRWRPRQPAQRTASTPRRLPSGAASQLDPSHRSSWVSSTRP